MHMYTHRERYGYINIDVCTTARAVVAIPFFGGLQAALLAARLSRSPYVSMMLVHSVHWLLIARSGQQPAASRSVINESMRQMMAHASLKKHAPSFVSHCCKSALISLLNKSMRQMMAHASFRNEQTNKSVRQ